MEKDRTCIKYDHALYVGVDDDDEADNALDSMVHIYGEIIYKVQKDWNRYDGKYVLRNKPWWTIVVSKKTESEIKDLLSPKGLA